MKKMKILQVIETFYPNVTGPANIAFDISSRLGKQGISPQIITTDFKARGSKPAEKIKNVLVRRFPVCYRFMQYAVSRDMKKFLEKEKCDIIHVHNYRGYHTQTAFQIAKKRKIPFVITPHGGLLGYQQYLRGINRLPYLLFDFFTGKKAALEADAVIVLSKREYADALKYGVKKNRLHLIPVGINVTEYAPFPKNSNTLRVLFVGRITRNRNIEPIIRAAEIIKKSHLKQKIIFVIVGGEVKTSSTSRSGYIDELKQLAKNLGVSDIVDFTGPKYGKDLKDQYRKADIFVYTSISENFGLPILEAAAAGLPIISTSVGIVPEIIIDGVNGFLIEGKPQEIANRISDLLNAGRRNRFGELTKERVQKNFDWNEIMRKYSHIYRSVGEYCAFSNKETTHKTK
jgi:glycosyltransferase involved in cell wall biosynthesis